MRVVQKVKELSIIKPQDVIKLDGHSQEVAVGGSHKRHYNTKMKMFKLYFIHFLLGTQCVIGFVGSYTINDEIRLHRDKLTTLYPYVRPKNVTSEPVLVSLACYFLNIYYLDEKEQLLKFNSWYDIRWTNDLLAWDESEYGGLSSTRVNVDKIWLPDLYIMNAVGEKKFLHGEVKLATLASSGLVVWWPSKTFSTKCPVDTKKYPFDVQKCEIELIKWLNHDQLVMIKPMLDNMNLDFYSENGEWDIQSISQIIMPEIFEGLNTTKLTWTIELKRKSGFYILNIILPITVLSFLDVFCFMLPTEGSEKIGYSVSIFLTFSVFMLMISESLPKTSDEICLLSVFILLQVTYSALIIIINVLILKLVHTGGDKEMDSKCLIWLKNICECMKKNQMEDFMDTKTKIKQYTADNKQVTHEEERRVTTWKEFAKFLDKFCFLAFFCMNVFSYIVYIMLVNF